MIDSVGIDCCGCRACSAACPSSAIKFRKNGIGFDYPIIDSHLCTECNLCQRVCPALNDCDSSTSISSFAAYAKDKPNESSSGGAFFSIAKKIIQAGGVVYAASFDKSKTIKHRRIDNISDIIQLCGSKYVQSEIEQNVYRQVRKDLGANKSILFVGTPCQIAGLKGFLHKRYDNLFTIDLVCHGVPSPQIFCDYITYCERIRFKEISNFIFRDNRDGWNNDFKSTIVYYNGRCEYNTLLSNLWNRIFFSELCSRQCCHTCKYARLQRLGDITLGDFWGIKGDFDTNGVSLVLCNSLKGKTLIEESGLVLFNAYTNSSEHPNLYKPTQPNPQSIEFEQYYQEQGFKRAMKRYFEYTPWLDFKVKIYRIVSSIIGMR